MKYNQIPNTDLKVSSIALGTWVFGGDMWGGADENDAMEAIAAALEGGVNIIDTAPVYGYGKAECIVGKAVKKCRDKVVIATKCGLTWAGKKISINLAPASVKKEVEDSRKRLQIDCIDIYQCHWPDPKTPIEKTLEAMCRLKDQGKIRHIGVSNFDSVLLKAALEYTGIATLQNQYSLLDRSIEKDVLALTREKGVGVISYGPLAGGILSGKYQSAPEFSGQDARSFFYKYYSGKSFEDTQKIIAALNELGKPLNQIAINWVRQQAGVTSVIVGCRNAEQAGKNVSAADWELSGEALEKIAAVLP